MTAVLVGVAALVPLLSTLTYRRTGLTWARAAAYAALALALTMAGVAISGVAEYGVGIETGLCGTIPDLAVAAGAVAYLVVASWAALAARRLWAWPFAVWTAVAVTILVAYFYAGAHHYCET